MTAKITPALAPDLVAGLRRLKLAKVRAIAPEVLITAKTQRWPSGVSPCATAKGSAGAAVITI